MKNRSRLFSAILCLLILIPLTVAHGQDGLIGKSGITPQAVHQGALGSCYFYASIAALAGSQPSLLRTAIEPSDAESFNVRFADGKVEQVHLEDVKFARSSGFDRSDGLWAPVLFRAYAQRTLRAELLKAINASSLPPAIKLFAPGMVESGDLVLLAYDRAIRSQVNQGGSMNRDSLKSQLRVEMKPVPLPQQLKDTALQIVDGSGVFDSLAAAVNSNGEIFGAYRSAGSGGLAEEVMQALTGVAKNHRIKASQESATAIARALEEHQAVVASTKEAPLSHLVVHAPSLAEADDWYVESHVYTVMAVDLAAHTITLRNPWGEHPSPEGQFTIPLEQFVAGFEEYTVGAAPVPQSAREAILPKLQ